ncbi:hypothetical protein L3Y34_013791 [Caenorhabditis briggsae]|uniref:Uncharacterized protein n=1 Tax=Caenorhabditis briggsae TaxID=6238 RepID=A0AAE9A267_CAEBR|nr:hypothetical protein L3Y34_013791 [Caenorhabditis briggsae]
MTIVTKISYIEGGNSIPSLPSSLFLCSIRIHDFVQLKAHLLFSIVSNFFSRTNLLRKCGVWTFFLANNTCRPHICSATRDEPTMFDSADSVVKIVFHPLRPLKMFSDGFTSVRFR